MFYRIIFFIVAFLSFRTCSANNFCSHVDTNGLAGDHRFAAKLKSFLRQEELPDSSYRQRAYDVALANMGGPSEKWVSIGNSSMFAAACRPHDCGDKAAVVISCPDTIRAVGVVHYGPQPILTVWSSTRNKAVLDAFASWKEEISRAENKNVIMRLRMRGAASHR